MALKLKTELFSNISYSLKKKGFEHFPYAKHGLQLVIDKIGIAFLQSLLWQHTARLD